MAKTMTKLFTDIFDEPLKARGFHRKGKVYCKLKGEFIYGVTIKPINPYDICFGAVPYWLIQEINSSFSSFMGNFHKGYWIENAGCEIGCSLYYRIENEALNEDFMKMCLSILEKYAIPYMESIKSIEDYIQPIAELNEDWLKKEYQSDYGRVYKIFPGVLNSKYTNILQESYDFSLGFGKNFFALQYALLDIAQKDGSFDRAYSIWQHYVEEGRLKKDVFREKMKENDLDWILRYKEEQRKFILPHLRDELKINTAIL